MLRALPATLAATAIGAAALFGGVFMGPSEAAAQQRGLVNVNIEDVTIQVPVAVAANICDVNANVLARQLRAGGAECDAAADADA